MVCQYMKKHPDYRQACLRSTYFNPNGRESLMSVNERWNHPVKLPTLYQHMQRHQQKDIQRGEVLAKIQGKESVVWQRTAGNRGIKKPDKEALENTEKIVEAPVLTGQNHELGLDEFIQLGRAKLSVGDMNISAANLITAIKVKADIEKSTKDRRMDMLRTMFSGAAPKEKDES